MLAKIFKAYDIRAIYPDPLNEAAAYKVGFAAGQFYKKAPRDGVQNPNTVLVSRDMRPHSPPLAEALTNGLRDAGLDVIDLGMCDTSFMYFAVNHLGTIGGIQTTASHNPIQYNGFKLSGPQAKPIGASTGLKEIQAIAESLADKPVSGNDARGSRREMDLWAEYRKHILQFFVPPKRKLKVVIDASNGMAGKLVPSALADLPNIEIVPINFEITGRFVHEPNPLVAENMLQTQQGVSSADADLGVCFDGDADRCILTDERGVIIGCDHLTGLFADYFLKKAPGAAVVYDLRSSKSVPETIVALGGEPGRSRVGHVFMKQMMRDMQGIVGGELSGHFYFRDNFYADSGAIAYVLALSILGQSDQPMSVLMEPYDKYYQSGEVNYHAEDKAAVIAALKERFGARASIDELDGVTIDAWDQPVVRSEGEGETIDGGGWWFNVRASNTEPLLRLNAEAKSCELLDEIVGAITPMLGEPEGDHDYGPRELMKPIREANDRSE